MKYCLCFLLLTFVSQICGIIIETAHFQELAKHVETGDLVLLDIDDTLLVPTQMLGCDEWFMHRCNYHCSVGMDPSDALEQSLSEWQAIRFLTAMEIVEPGTREVVSSLQEKGICLMGLTTQGLALATRTVHQLKEHQFHLELTAPSQEEHCFPIRGHSALYRKGVLFTSGRPKGEALFTLFEKIGFSPKKIVFINDKGSHLQDVEKGALEHGVEFIGLRYSFSDSRKEIFSAEIANYQFAHSTFEHLLSDEEAKARMRN